MSSACDSAPNYWILCELDDQRQSCDVCSFSKMAAIPSQIYFRYGHVSPPVWSKTIGIPDIDQISQSTAQILLFPVSVNKRPPYWNSISGFDFDHSTVTGMQFSIGPQIGIGSSMAELWCHSDFQDGSREPCWIWFRVMVARPRSVSGGLCFILKFWLDWIYSFGDSAIFIFWHFGLKLPIHAHFLGVWGDIFPNDVVYRFSSQKGTSMCRNTLFEP